MLIKQQVKFSLQIWGWEKEHKNAHPIQFMLKPKTIEKKAHKYKD